MYYYSIRLDPINPHQPIQVSTRLLHTNQTEAVDSRSEEERSTEEGSTNLQTSQSCFNNPGYTVVIINEQISNANSSDPLCGRMESDGRVVDEQITLHDESIRTDETNARHSRLPHPPYEKWNSSFFKDYK